MTAFLINSYLNDVLLMIMTDFYTQSDFRAGFLRRNPAVAIAWPTLATTELPAEGSAGGWPCSSGGGIGGDFPSGRKRTSPGGGILQLYCKESWQNNMKHRNSYETDCMLTVLIPKEIHDIVMN